MAVHIECGEAALLEDVYGDRALGEARSLEEMLSIPGRADGSQDDIIQLKQVALARVEGD